MHLRSRQKSLSEITSLILISITFSILIRGEDDPLQPVVGAGEGLEIVLPLLRKWMQRHLAFL